MIPKSLHTVTVLVNVARKLRTIHCNLSPRSLISEAVAVLGYGDTPDVYGLATKAVAILEKETAKPAPRASTIGDVCGNALDPRNLQ
jgi:hypothetical protein